METDDLGTVDVKEKDDAVVDNQSTVIELVKEKFPDSDFLNEYDAVQFLLAKIQGYEDENSQMQQLADENPEIAMLFSEMAKNDTGKRRSIVSILTEAGVDLTPPAEGEGGYEDYDEVVKRRSSRKKEAEKRKKELEANYLESVAVIEKFFKDKDLSEEEEKAFIEFYEDVVDSSNRNLYTEKTLNKIFQAFKYEEDVESARQAGEIDGRNAKIEDKRKKANQTTDGLASNGGAVTTPGGEVKKSGYIERLMEGKY